MIYRFDKVTSTNDVAKMTEYLDVPNGTVFVAAEQTAGRGRYGKQFYSPTQLGIYMTVVLYVDEVENAGADPITIRAAEAVCRVLERHSGKALRIKPINDIFLVESNRKICGILVENNSSLPNRVIVGIGINYAEPCGGYPADIADTAGALFCTEDEAEHVSKDMLISDIAKELLSEFTAKE